MQIKYKQDINQRLIIRNALSERISKNGQPHPSLKLSNLNTNLLYDDKQLSIVDFLILKRNNYEPIRDIDTANINCKRSFFENEIEKYPLNMRALMPNNIFCLEEGAFTSDISNILSSSANTRSFHHELFHWLDFSYSLRNILIYFYRNLYMIDTLMNLFLPISVGVSYTRSEADSIYKSSKYFVNWWYYLPWDILTLIKTSISFLSRSNYIWRNVNRSLQTDTDRGFVTIASRSNHMEDRATIAEMLFCVEADIIGERLYNDPKLKAKTELLTGYDFNAEKGVFTHLLSSKELFSRFGIKKHYWYAKWSLLNGYPAMDAAFWNNIISENIHDFSDIQPK